jgi:hypothetical protein
VWRSSLHTQRVRMLSIYRDQHGSIRSDDSRTLPPEVIWIDLLNPTDDEKAFVEKHGDDQAGTGALRVIERVEDMGNVPGAGTTTRQRSHDHTIFAVQRTNREWTEKIDQLHLPRACRRRLSADVEGKLAVMRMQNAERGKRILILVLLSVCNDDPCAEATREFALDLYRLPLRWCLFANVTRFPTLRVRGLKR